MPPKKKPPKNAFFFFMLDYKEKQEKLGKRFPGGLAQVSGVCGRIWGSMDEKERAPFKAMEKEAKKVKSINDEPLTSQGVPVKVIEEKHREQDLQEREMKMSIQETVQESVMYDTLATHKYYFIAGNYFCRTNDGIYTPAEISVVEFSLQEGISNKFHSFINPGNLPLGMTLTAKEYSEGSHQLPIPPHAMGESNFVRLLSEITRFIGCDAVNELPPMYTSREMMPVVKSIISQLCLDANEDESLFRIYQLNELFFVLKQAAAKCGQHADEGFPTLVIAQAALERDQYECQAGIACDYHENLDVGKYCTLSQVSRWAFIFSDHICLDLAISLVPGHHVPKGTDTTIPKCIVFEEKPLEKDDDDYDDIDEYDRPERRPKGGSFVNDNTDLPDLGDFCPLETKEDQFSGKRKFEPDFEDRGTPRKFGRGASRGGAGPSRGFGTPNRSFGRGRLLD